MRPGVKFDGGRIITNKGLILLYFVLNGTYVVLMTDSGTCTGVGSRTDLIYEVCSYISYPLAPA